MNTSSTSPWRNECTRGKVWGIYHLNHINVGYESRPCSSSLLIDSTLLRVTLSHSGSYVKGIDFSPRFECLNDQFKCWFWVEDYNSVSSLKSNQIIGYWYYRQHLSGWVSVEQYCVINVLLSFKKRVYELVSATSYKLFLALFFPLIQSGHKFAHVSTTELSWHMQNHYLFELLLIALERYISIQNFRIWD